MKNALHRMEMFNEKLPSVEKFEAYLAANEFIVSELEAVVAQYDRKISYRMTVDKITHFLSLSMAVLDKIKKLIKAAAVVKSSGTSLLS